MGLVTMSDLMGRMAKRGSVLTGEDDPIPAEFKTLGDVYDASVNLLRGLLSRCGGEFDAPYRTGTYSRLHRASSSAKNNFVALALLEAVEVTGLQDDVILLEYTPTGGIPNVHALFLDHRLFPAHYKERMDRPPGPWSWLYQTRPDARIEDVVGGHLFPFNGAGHGSLKELAAAILADETHPLHDSFLAALIRTWDGLVFPLHGAQVPGGSRDVQPLDEVTIRAQDDDDDDGVTFVRADVPWPWFDGVAAEVLLETVPDDEVDHYLTLSGRTLRLTLKPSTGRCSRLFYTLYNSVRLLGTPTGPVQSVPGHVVVRILTEESGGGIEAAVDPHGNVKLAWFV